MRQLNEDRVELCNSICDKVEEYCKKYNVEYSNEMLFIGLVIVQASMEFISEEGIKNEIKGNS